MTRIRLLATVASAALLALGLGYAADRAMAQAPNLFGSEAEEANPDARMLLQADELIYNYDENIVTADGNVEIYYDGYALNADRVIYNRETERVQAEGNIRIIQPDGNTIYAETADVTEDLRDGFVEALRVESVDNTRFAAVSAERLPGDVTVFRSGVYTACEPCEGKPDRPPIWQVRAQRIIYDRQEKVVYYRNARLELFGLPIAYFPYFSHPDPDNARRSGFLTPSYSYVEKLGHGLSTPYFFALSPHYDATISPTVYSRQGVLLEGEFRQRLMNGSYAIRPAGIFQLDPEAFDGTVGDGKFRGAVRTEGNFSINSRWSWGWDITAQTDRAFLRNYDLVPDSSEDIQSDIFLTGLSGKNYFDGRLIRFESPLNSDDPEVLPFVHPVIDYNYIFGRPVFGGELSFDANVTSLSREGTDSFGIVDEDGISREFFRGVEGSMTRVSVDTQWRRMMVGPMGQLFTPFLAGRTDLYWLDVDQTPGDGTSMPMYPEFFDPAETLVVRGMPTIGMEYRWPLVASSTFGLQTVSPIAQVIARPDEPNIGDIPNEDAQSLLFDDTTLFERDKFSGFDRVEGGVRANAGLSYTFETNSGAAANVLFGQSFHVAGKNSFDVPDLLNTGADSGLESDRSDYVGRILLQPTQTISAAARFRLDEETFETERLEVGAQARRGPVSGTLVYASLAERPDVGAEEREAVIGTANLKVSDFWSVSAGARYDLVEDEFRQSTLGLTYQDECLLVSLRYVGDFLSDEEGEQDHALYLRLELRTLGGLNLSRQLGTESGEDGGAFGGLGGI